MTATIDQVVERYVQLRDQRKAMDDAHAEKVKPLGEALQVMEAWLLAQLNQAKLDAAKTEFGTAYKSTVMSAGIENWDIFLGHVVGRALERALAAVENGGSEQDAAGAFLASPELGFLTRSVTKTAVEEYMQASKGKLPPGIKTAFITKINVRRG